MTFTQESEPFALEPYGSSWAEPVSRVPNFFGDFFGTGLGATSGGGSPLVYVGTGFLDGEGAPFLVVGDPGPGVTVTGPGGPFVLTDVLVPGLGVGTPQDVVVLESSQLSGSVTAAFPGAIFVSGTGTVIFGEDIDFTYTYFSAAGAPVTVALPNPAGGGLVGRNRYYENGSPIPRDRVYFFYSHVDDVQGLASPFNVNRYVFGGEKTFFEGRTSVELRVPFAGTADNVQLGNGTTTGTATEFGNVGLALKVVLVRTPTFLASAGLGFSFPTASDSRMTFAGDTIAVIENRTTLLQPMIGLAWAPNERFYAQSGLQFDLDPSGNPVRARNAGGELPRIGVLNDQEYLYFHNSIGYWFYENQASEGLTGIALQTELHYYQSFGSVDRVDDGVFNVTDLNNSLNVLNGSTGAIFRFDEALNVSLAVSYPLGGDRLYDWNLQAQVNYQFGSPR